MNGAQHRTSESPAGAVERLSTRCSAVIILGDGVDLQCVEQAQAGKDRCSQHERSTSWTRSDDDDQPSTAYRPLPLRHKPLDESDLAGGLLLFILLLALVLGFLLGRLT